MASVERYQLEAFQAKAFSSFVPNTLGSFLPILVSRLCLPNISKHFCGLLDCLLIKVYDLFLLSHSIKKSFEFAYHSFIQVFELQTFQLFVMSLDTIATIDSPSSSPHKTKPQQQFEEAQVAISLI